MSSSNARSIFNYYLLIISMWTFLLQSKCKLLLANINDCNSIVIEQAKYLNDLVYTDTVWGSVTYST